MKDRVCMVTGANAGIGKVTALELARQGATVVMVCRDSGRGEAAQSEIIRESGSDKVHLMLADLSSQASIRRLAAEFQEQFEQLHVLVNNAGAFFMRRQLSVDGLELTFALNHLGYFLLTGLLLPTIQASAPARIVNVSSMAQYRSSIDFDNLQREKGYRGMEAYGQSKLANVLFTYELARRLKGSGVTVNCLHPGFVASNFAKNNGFLASIAMNLAKLVALTPEKGAETSIYLASSPEITSVTGKYFVDKIATRSKAESYDEAIAGRLWQISEELTGHPFSANDLGAAD